MNENPLPDGFSFAPLVRTHNRKGFQCGQPAVDDWLKAKALQNQEKHLSSTKVLLADETEIAGYYTLATHQVDFGDLPPEIVKGLPRRMLPVALLAWLGVATKHQGKNLGRMLLAQALKDCYRAGQTFAVVAVVLDCIDDSAKSFYQRFKFEEVPGRPYQLFLDWERLERLLNVD